MNRTWKAFTIIVSALLCVVIVCVSINVSVSKITAKIIPETTDNTDNNVNAGLNTDNPSADPDVVVPGTPDDGSGSVDANSSAQNNPQSGGQQGGTVTTANQQGGSQQTADNPLNYDKAKIVNYYNTALKKTYSQPKFTVTKTEVVDVTLGEMTLDGKPATGIESLANKVVESNKKNKTTTKNFTSSTAVVDAQERYILPANLTPAAVKSYNVSKSGSGYVINFTLNQETCDFRSKPPYNSSCTFPLDFTEINLGGIGEITSAQFYYPGTTLTATVDSQGRVVKTYVVMPLTVDDATGKGMGKTLSVDISGKWLCTNINTF